MSSCYVSNPVPDPEPTGYGFFTVAIAAVLFENKLSY
jgi:hypothetical protein